MSVKDLQNLAYLLAAVCFIFDLKWMSHPRTAVRGNWIGVLGMAVAVVATLAGGVPDWRWILVGSGIGALVGTVSALRVPMTAMPEMVALFNGFGGAASALVAAAAFLEAKLHLLTKGAESSWEFRIATVASALIGSVTFFGSWVAFGKLAEFLAVRWKLRFGQKVLKYLFPFLLLVGSLALSWSSLSPAQPTGSDLFALFVVAVSGLAMAGILLLPRDRFPGMDLAKLVAALLSLVLAAAVVTQPTWELGLWGLLAASGLLGVLLTFAIGGADMPVVIALLNSYSGIAAAATGFVIENTVLIVSGSLVGASGIILTQIMCRAMNRSLTNVLFGALGGGSSGPSAEEVYKTVKSASPEEIALLLEGAQRVVIVPGYGMAVAQAQHAVRQLAQLLEERGARVEFAIHPVAGRMPGHMNVLLAEANVPYEHLREMDDINPEMEQVDVAIVVGANDVVNPAARTDPKSPIAGMPILDVDKARTVVVIKRSLSPGFAGIPNPLFAAPNTLMYFADGKKAIQDLITAVKEAA
jgi:NAD(P) transhydrogenase subunit beta